MALDILVVDDDARIVVRNLVEVLPIDKVALHSAYSGEEAVKRLQERDYGLVVLDYNMGGMNGFETAKAIREIKPNVRMIGFSSDWLNDEAEQVGLEFHAWDQGSISQYILRLLNN